MPLLVPSRVMTTTSLETTNNSPGRIKVCSAQIMAKKASRTSMAKKGPKAAPTSQKLMP